MAKGFFDEQLEQSRVKSAIVSKYFKSWSDVMLGHLGKTTQEKKIAYIDLFAGPGRYEDGATSTPLQILELAIGDEKLRDSLVTYFNDKDENNSNSLQAAIDSLKGIKKLKYKPHVQTEEVGTRMVGLFESMNLVPTLFFVDPWGYKGLSLKLINSVLKDWGCECVFFFNYNRINMGLSNDKVTRHMEALFGTDRAAELGSRLDDLEPGEREVAVVEEICNALIELGGKYVLPFEFKNEKGTRTKHHLIFVSKHPLGYKIMKNVMANESSDVHDGVASFQYSPATKRQPTLFGFSRPLDDLEEMLMQAFQGRTMSMIKIYDEHNYGTPYVEKNYKAVLNKLEAEGKITADPPSDKRQKRNGEPTFADKVEVTFPKRKKAKAQP